MSERYGAILLHPDERLLTPSQPVDEAFIQSGELWNLIGMMKMHLVRSGTGIGLAANQIGGDRRVIVVALPNGGEEYVMVNPEITKRRGETMSGEQCLSVRDEGGIMTEYYVVRPKSITVRFQEPYAVAENRCEFVERTIKCTGLLARCICHEVDHLDGITLVERGRMGSCLAS